MLYFLFVYLINCMMHISCYVSTSAQTYQKRLVLQYPVTSCPTGFWLAIKCGFVVAVFPDNDMGWFSACVSVLARSMIDCCWNVPCFPIRRIRVLDVGRDKSYQPSVRWPQNCVQLMRTIGKTFVTIEKCNISEMRWLTCSHEKYKLWY